MQRLSQKKRPIICGSLHALLPAILWLLVPFFWIIPCQASDPPSLKALFPVGIDHEFPQSERTFQEVRDLILAHYYTEDITGDALYWAAIQGMLRHISPPGAPTLASIWTADAYEKFLHSLKGEQVSLGIKSTFNPGDGSLTVTEVVPDAPADGILKPLDRILRINGSPLKGKTAETINRLLAGSDGEEIQLTVNRDIRVFDVHITCRKFEQQLLVITRLTDAMALVEIKRFTSGMAQALKAELAGLKSAGFRQLIIDLRNNPGGVFLEALKSAELFLPKNHILMRSLTRDAGMKNYVSVNTDPFEFDMAVLINHQTASSSEILASALQDQRKAILIGTHTYGKGIFEKTFTLSNHMRVKFITGAMVSPKGHTWHGKGVKPDFLVQQDEKALAALFKMAPEQRAGKDVAMITAIKLLGRFGARHP